jgi:hypothetical protein
VSNSEGTVIEDHPSSDQDYHRKSRTYNLSVVPWHSNNESCEKIHENMSLHYFWFEWNQNVQFKNNKKKCKNPYNIFVWNAQSKILPGFVSFDFVSFRSVSFDFVSFRFDRFFVSFGLISFRFVFISFRTLQVPCAVTRKRMGHIFFEWNKCLCMYCIKQHRNIKRRRYNIKIWLSEIKHGIQIKKDSNSLINFNYRNLNSGEYLHYYIREITRK